MCLKLKLVLVESSFIEFFCIFQKKKNNIFVWPKILKNATDSKSFHILLKKL